MKRLILVIIVVGVIACHLMISNAQAQGTGQIPLKLKSGTVMINAGMAYDDLKNALQRAMDGETPSDLSDNRIAYSYTPKGSGEKVMIYFLVDGGAKLEEVGLCSLNKSSNKPAQSLKDWLRSNVGKKKPEDKKVHKKSWGPFVAAWEPKESKRKKKKRLTNEFWEAGGFRISEECYGEGANTCFELKMK